jgi:protein-tyrosine phosphatase
VAESPVDSLTAEALVALGGDPAGFVARQVEAVAIRDADLVLTMTRRHREAVLHLVPGALRRTFTLPEAAALLPLVDVDSLPTALPARGTALVTTLAGARARRGRFHPADDDVADPIGRDRSIHAAVAEQIHGCLTPLLTTLCHGVAPTTQDPVAEPA